MSTNDHELPLNPDQPAAVPKRRRVKKTPAPAAGRLEDTRQPELPIDLPPACEPVPDEWDQRDAG
jgi:hypothetical protein